MSKDKNIINKNTNKGDGSITLELSTSLDESPGSALEHLLADNTKFDSSRRRFLQYSWQICLFSYITSIHRTIQAKPTYNIAFWSNQGGSITPLLVSEISASIAIKNAAGNLKTSELSFAVSNAGGAGSLQTSELSAAVAAQSSTTTVDVSEVYVLVVAK